jgi:hypothetical protein
MKSSIDHLAGRLPYFEKAGTRETIKRRQARRDPDGRVKAGLLEPQ